MRLVEHTSGYNLEISYVKGIKLAIADVLSRMIQNVQTLREDFQLLSECNSVDALEQVRLDTEIVTDPLVCNMAREGNSDTNYKMMIKVIQDGVEFDKLSLDHPLRDYGNEFSHLALLETEGGQLVTYKCDRLIPPLSCRKELLNNLLGPDHSQFTRMFQEAKCHNWWPTIKENCRV